MSYEVMSISNLKRLRLQQKKTQVAVQLATGIDQSLLSKYERGERLLSAQDLLTLADFYQTSTDYLLGRTNRTEPYPKE